MIERRGKRYQPVTRNTPVSRPQSHATTQSRGLAYGPASITAQRSNAFIGRHRHRTAATRTPGNAIGIPRITGRTECGIFIGTAHGKLVHVQAAKNDSPRGAQFLNHRGIIRAIKFAQNFAGTIERLILNRQYILNRHRHAEHWQVFARGARLIRGIRLRQSISSINADKGIEPVIHFFYTIQTSLRGLPGTQFAGAQLLKQLMNR